VFGGSFFFAGGDIVAARDVETGSADFFAFGVGGGVERLCGG
jgi:hypothetical protein